MEKINKTRIVTQYIIDKSREDVLKDLREWLSGQPNNNTNSVQRHLVDVLSDFYSYLRGGSALDVALLWASLDCFMKQVNGMSNHSFEKGRRSALKDYAKKIQELRTEVGE